MRWVSSLLLAVAVMPAGAGAVKSKSLAQAQAILDQAVARDDPSGFMRAAQMARLAIDAPRHETLFLEARALYALAWTYFLNDETVASLAQAQHALGVLNQAVDAAEKPTLAMRSYRVMIVALLRQLGETADIFVNQRAEVDMRTLIEKGGDNPQALYARAFAAFHRSALGKPGDDLDEALTLFERLREQNPGNRTAQAFVIFLNAKADSAPPADAARQLTEMLSADPTFRLAVFLRGHLSDR